MRSFTSISSLKPEDGKAARYGMAYDYKTARRNGLDPLEALEDWDLIRPEERALFLEPYSTTTAPQPLIAGKDPQSPAPQKQ